MVIRVEDTRAVVAIPVAEAIPAAEVTAVVAIANHCGNKLL